MELELKHLSAYLPYGLDVKLGYTVRDLTAVSLDSKFVFVTANKGAREKQMTDIKSIKPLLRPVSDITKEIKHNGKKFVPCDELDWVIRDGLVDYVKNRWNGIEYFEIQKLLEWHFDVFGLIDAGLAIKK